MVTIEGRGVSVGIFGGVVRLSVTCCRLGEETEDAWLLELEEVIETVVL